MVIVLMGVSGAGKTTVGLRLAADLGWPFADGDDWHPAQSVARMRAGLPLRDEDRAPWLAALRCAIAGWLAEGRDAVLACSALKAAYRRALVPDGAPAAALRFVHLQAEAGLLAERLAGRSGHFMPPALLASQLATLEAPADAITVDAAPPPADIAREIRARLGLTA